MWDLFQVVCKKAFDAKRCGLSKIQVKSFSKVILNQWEYTGKKN